MDKKLTLEMIVKAATILRPADDIDSLVDAISETFYELEIGDIFELHSANLTDFVAECQENLGFSEEAAHGAFIVLTEINGGKSPAIVMPEQMGWSAATVTN